MNARSATSIVLSAAALATLCGCGAVFHASQTVTVTTNPADKAKVYQAGTLLTGDKPGEGKAKVFLNTTLGEIVAVAPGMKVKRIALDRYVDGVAIVCDVLWTLTIVGVAAPLSDLALGTFVKTETDVDVKFEPFAATENPMPVYSVFGTTVTADEQLPPVSTSAAPAASSAAPAVGSAAPATTAAPGARGMAGDAAPGAKPKPKP